MRSMKILTVVFLGLVLAGCGYVDREVSKVTGKGSVTCQDGINYLQFTSGAVVKIDPETLLPEKC